MSKPKRKTQKQMVKDHLVNFGKITTWEAFQYYGITRLSQYIYLLRQDGETITNKTIETKNRYGDPIHYDEYHWSTAKQRSLF